MNKKTKGKKADEKEIIKDIKEWLIGKDYIIAKHV